VEGALNQNNLMTRLKYLTACALIPVLFASCEQKKKEAEAPAKAEKEIQPATTSKPSKPKKTGIPAVEAARRIGNDLEKNAQKSNDLLNDATKKR
jgi:hypothetical protein